MADSEDFHICIDLAKPGYGCQRYFRQKTTAGLCARCAFLCTCDQTSDDFKKMSAAPFCTGCGAIVMFMAPGKVLCGTCERTADDSYSAEKLAKDLQNSKNLARVDATQQRMLPKGAPTAPPKPSPHAAAGATGGRNIRVFLHPVAPRTGVSGKIFIASSTYSESEPFSSCIDHLLAQWNVTWEKDTTESLTRDHVSIRFWGNLAITPGSDLETVGYFHDKNEPKLNPNIAKRAPSTVQPGTTGPFIYLEGVINVREFEDSTGCCAPHWALPEKENKKRRESSSTDTSELLSKRSKTSSSVALRSTWVARIPAGMTKIILLYASICRVENSSTSDEYKLVWPENLDNLKTGYISDLELDHGATKRAYQLLVDNKPFVAKRFYNVGGAETSVSPEMNLKEIESEVFRLARAKEVLEALKAHAREAKISISQDVRVTDFQIAVEVLAKNAVPSLASGLTVNEVKHLQPQDRAMAWLIEPQRPQGTVQKWSGTMQHPTHNSKLGLTMSIFAHFSLEWTGKTLVFVDLQTSAANEPGKGLSNVLFDVMSHTITGDSGLGDFGHEGIQNFIDGHHCSQKCEQLGLKPLKELEGEGEEGSGGTSGEE